MPNRIARGLFEGAVALIAAGALASVAQAGETPNGVAFEQSDAGKTFVTTDRRALYWSRSELSAGAITCIEACLDKARPLLVSADAPPPPGWTVVTRPEGDRQWAFEGKALYTSVADTFPGARLGAEGPWVLTFETAPLPASFTLQTTLVGRVLADHKGRTLYTGQQLRGEHWLPVTAPWLAHPSGDWTFEPLPDGARQWAYRGQRLFRHGDDEDPQDLNGQGVDGAKAAVLEPPPGTPPWMTIQRVDLDWVFADRNGLTVYAPDTMEQILAAQTCPAECMATYWRPILAGPDEAPVGRWSIVTVASGERQWAFKGRLLFTHTRDSKPGEMTGNSFAVGYSIGDGFRVIPIEANLPPAI
ncbi:MAG: hypothetical protein FJX59_10290 [Alphaproteobacteria bacterium]|nr:hypothetical protein [Alphaproteobacteria bacterium]